MQSNPNRISISLTAAAAALGMARGWILDDRRIGLRWYRRAPHNSKRRTLRTHRTGR